MRPLAKWIFWMVALPVLISGCGINKYLEPGEELVVQNSIQFEKGQKPANRSNLRYELTTLYKQQPNETWLGFFRIPLWAYFKLESSAALAEEENWLERGLRKIVGKRVAEPPTLYNQKQTEATAQAMEFYLQNRGFFNAEVAYEKSNRFRWALFERRDGGGKVRLLGRKPTPKVEVDYFVRPGEQYLIDTVIFDSEDPGLNYLLEEIREQSFLKPGEPLDGKTYDLETSRITKYLRNKGYAYFNPNYIAPLEADTSGQKAWIRLSLLRPGRLESHRQYRVGRISIDPRFNPVLDTGLVMDTLIGGFWFKKVRNEKFWVRPAALQESIFLRRDSLYNLSAIDKTNRRLSDLGIYRFVSIRPVEDTLTGLMDFDIQLTPSKKWVFEMGGDLNNTERNLTDNRLNLLGFEIGTSLLNRNFLRGAELFSVNTTAAFEINVEAIGNNFSGFWNTLDLRLQFDLFTPKFVDFLGIYSGLRRLRIMKPDFYRTLREKAPTRISGGYNYLSLANFYNYHLFNASFGYDLQEGQKRYILNNLAIDFLNPSIQPQFDTILQQNPFLANSFGDQLFTGLFFRDYNYFYNSRINKAGASFYLKGTAEISGWEIWAANKITNGISGRQDTFRFGESVDFSQFGKFELDLGYQKQFNPRHSLALRLNAGIASPFGFSGEVPYVKQFYVGGPQSIRAWGARGIGPGSYRDPLTENPDNRLLFYQTGDFKLEMNAEYRFDLFKLFALVTEGAVFLDAGNVWTIRPDERSGGQLRWSPETGSDGEPVGDNFLKEMAIGTGFGLRFDFSYFLLRLDMGYRLKNPYQRITPSGTRTYWAYSNWSELTLGDINYNIGINYPF